MVTFKKFCHINVFLKWLVELQNFFIVYMIVQSAVTIRTFSYECIRSIEPIPQISVLLVEVQTTLIRKYLRDSELGVFQVSM